eukprot:1182770-Prorocentrum_minimum.AAC.7
MTDQSAAGSKLGALKVFRTTTPCRGARRVKLSLRAREPCRTSEGTSMPRFFKRASKNAGSFLPPGLLLPLSSTWGTPSPNLSLPLSSGGAAALLAASASGLGVESAGAGRLMAVGAAATGTVAAA